MNEQDREDFITEIVDVYKQLTPESVFIQPENHDEMDEENGENALDAYFGNNNENEEQ